MPPVRPTCLALVLCDTIERDASGRATLSGVFQDFTIARFPATWGPFNVWLQVTNGHGTPTMKLRLEHATSWDRINLDHEGDYRMTLLADGIAIMQRSIVATSVQ